MMEETAPCPFCKGRGRLYGRGIPEGGIMCVECDGTGDRDGLWLLRAFRLGVEMHRAAIMAGTFEVKDPGLEDIRSVISESLLERQMAFLRARSAEKSGVARHAET